MIKPWISIPNDPTRVVLDTDLSGKEWRLMIRDKDVIDSALEQIIILKQIIIEQENHNARQ